MAFQTIKPFHANLLSFYSFRDPTGLTLHYVLWSDTPPALKSPAIEKETLDLGQVWNASRQVPMPTQQVLDTGNNSSCKTEDILFWDIADGPYQLTLLDRSNSYTDVVIKWNISRRAGSILVKKITTTAITNPQAHSKLLSWVSSVIWFWICTILWSALWCNTMQ